jgi:hypothetical protein
MSCALSATMQKRLLKTSQQPLWPGTQMAVSRVEFFLARLKVLSLTVVADVWSHELISSITCDGQR